MHDDFSANVWFSGSVNYTLCQVTQNFHVHIRWKSNKNWKKLLFYFFDFFCCSRDIKDLVLSKILSQHLKPTQIRGLLFLLVGFLIFRIVMCVTVRGRVNLFLSTLKLNIGQLSTYFVPKLTLLNVNFQKLELSFRERYITIRISKQSVEADMFEKHTFSWFCRLQTAWVASVNSNRVYRLSLASFGQLSLSIQPNSSVPVVPHLFSQCQRENPTEGVALVLRKHHLGFVASMKGDLWAKSVNLNSRNLLKVLSSGFRLWNHKAQEKGITSEVTRKESFFYSYCPLFGNWHARKSFTAPTSRTCSTKSSIELVSVDVRNEGTQNM